MGLDMYLIKKTYVWTDHKADKRDLHKMKITNEKYSHVKPERIKEIIEEVGYWRKANQIHLWFVANVQSGKDDCEEYSVSEDQLKDLLGICKEIKAKCKLTKGKIRNGQTMTNEGWQHNMEDGKLMKNSNIAAKLLPTKSGFFFGSTDYDQYYMDDIENTIKIIEDIFAEKGTSEYLAGDIYYQSSW